MLAFKPRSKSITTNPHVRDPRTAQVGEEILPFETGYLPEYFQKKAETELHETSEKRVQCVRQLKEMAKRDKRTKYVDFDDDFFLQHLRTTKFNMEKAFSNLKAFASFVKKQPQIFSGFNYDITVRCIKDKIFTMLPWRCQDGCTIILFQLDNWRPDKFPVEEIQRMLAVMLLQSLKDPMTQVNGFKVILDVKSSTFRCLRHITPHNIYLLYHGTQECVPGRYKGIHIVNDSLTFKAAWLIMKHFLSDKLKRRFHFHSSHETLLDFFPRAVLPASFGGDLTDYDQSAWLKKMMTPEKLDTLGGGSLKQLLEII